MGFFFFIGGNMAVLTKAADLWIKLVQCRYDQDYGNDVVDVQDLIDSDVVTLISTAELDLLTEDSKILSDIKF